ncbi:MAG: hypothetical protein U0169_04245 [Polyangiaceae bacterium]
MTLDDVLHALLFRRSFRLRFLAGERTSLGIDPEDEADLATLDPAELESSARLACRSVLDRSHRGVGSLRDAFPKTMALWTSQRPRTRADGFDDAQVDPDELAFAFAESTAFAAWTPMAGGDAFGPPLEDAFRLFAEEDLGPTAVATARAECAFAILRALVVNPEPRFAVPAFVRRAPRGFYVVLENVEGPFLVAALGGRLVTGPVTPTLAAILRGEEATIPAAERPGLEAARTGLRELGLVA